MSIALMNEVEALKKRMTALEELARTLAAELAKPEPQSTLRMKQGNRAQAQ